MQKPRLKIIVPILLLIFLVAWYGILIVGFIQSGYATGADFHWFYVVGKVWRETGAQHVYDLDLALSGQVEVTGVEAGEKLLLLPNHPPFVFPRMMLLAALPYQLAYVINMIYSVLIQIPFLILIFNLLRRLSWAWWEAFLMTTGVLLFEPSIISILQGQDTYLLLIGGVLLLCGFSANKNWMAGVGLGLTLVRPQITLVLALPFLFQRRRIFWFFLASSFILGLGSFLLVGWQGALKFIEVLLLSTGVEAHGWDEVFMFNLVGLLIRSFPGLNIDLVHTIGWTAFTLSIIGVCVFVYITKSIRTQHISLAIVLALFTAPHLHYHDLALLAIPLVLLGLSLVELQKLPVGIAAIVPTAVSILLVFGDYFETIRLTVPYLLMLGLAYQALKTSKNPMVGQTKGW